MSVTEVPIVTATIKGAKATVFVVEGDVAKLRSVPIKGEGGGKLYLAQDLKPGTKVVTEGRALLNDGDKVAAKLDPGTYSPADTGRRPPAGQPASPSAPRRASGAKP